MNQNSLIEAAMDGCVRLLSYQASKGAERGDGCSLPAAGEKLGFLTSGSSRRRTIDPREVSTSGTGLSVVMSLGGRGHEFVRRKKEKDREGVEFGRGIRGEAELGERRKKKRIAYLGIL